MNGCYPSCHEFLGDIVLALAPLVRHRNEMIHQYIKINWQNIVAVKQKVPSIRGFADKISSGSEPPEP